MKSKILFVAMLACLGIFGCRKINVADTERIAHTWKLNKYLVNHTDHTDSLLISDYTEKIENYDFYGYSYSFIDFNHDTIAEHGSTYTLFEDKDSIYFYASFKIHLTYDDTIDGYRFCRIISTSEETFVYEFSLNGRLHEFQMLRID